ncbi:MAG TPA: hypothetical protein VMJ65_21855 [Solirubrobacteraceae bacterium]|nr:hypothetical protein [Solirubrobacteraceae bacterium]
MKVLLITDGTDCTDSNETPSGIVYCDWVNTLTREGVPYQTMVTSDASPGSVALPTLSTTSGDGTQVANYEGVVVATSGPVGISTAQWDTLQTFEHQFSVRQLTAYAPIEQLTMAQIGTLSSEQAGWAAADTSQVSGYIEGNVVTVNNNGAATEIPLTGTNIGTPYAGTVSGWTNGPTGTSTYTALAAWPALPTTAVVLTPPTGPAPAGPLATGGKPTNQQPPAASKPSLYYVAVQVAPKKVSMKKGTATVSLKCEAKNGKAAKNHFCTGKFTLNLMGKTVTHSFRIKATKTARIAVKLPKKALLAARAAAAYKRHVSWHGALVVSTKQPQGPAKLTRGTLTIKT